jgi:hypothetical protein
MTTSIQIPIIDFAAFSAGIAKSNLNILLKKKQITPQ